MLRKSKVQNDITEIDSSVSIKKTSSSETFSSYCTYICVYNKYLFNFYGSLCSNERFLRYWGSQKATTKMIYIMTNGGRKYGGNKISKHIKR